MSKQSNLAYDLEKFSERPKVEEGKAKIKIERGNRDASSAPKFIVSALAVGVSFGMIVLSKVENTTLHNEIRNCNNEISQLMDENVRMQSEIESKSALKNVENYAENVLGLQKLDKSQIEYIKLEKDNVIEIPEVEENFFMSVKNFVNDFWEYISG